MRLLPIVLVGLAAAAGAQDGDWRHYHRDLRGTRYSPLAQITKENVRDLRVAWTWKSDNVGSPPEFKNETTPISCRGSAFR